MKPGEIVGLLNENKHDGECDWSYFELHGEGCYWSKNQRLRCGYTCPLSPASGEIIAKHYFEVAVLAEQDKRIEQREEHHG